MPSPSAALHHPDQLDPCGGPCVQRYGYNGTTGTLDTLVHPSATGGTLTTRFDHDGQGRLLTTYHPGGVSMTRSYDADGRVYARSGGITADNLVHDATGRVISGSVIFPANQTQRNLLLGYSGLGALQYADGPTAGVNYEEFKTDALGNRLWVRDHEMVDGVNRTRYHTIASENGQLTASALGTGACAPPGWTMPSCHPTWYEYEYGQSHDLSGNVDATWGFDTRGTSSTSEQVPEESRSYYAADEKLAYHNRHLGWSTPGEGTGVFEEYRYDALGRRVYMRSRRPSTCAYPCEAYVQRTVWDGDQVLYEIRSSSDTASNSIYLNREGAAATGDDPNLHGVVAYAHGPGIDQPVGILKRYASESGTGSWAYVTPHANWKGEWSYGTYSDGSYCLSTGQACPTWPGFYQSMDGSPEGNQPPTYTVWWGNIIRGQADASGLQYLRNRYYDPKTGRFTQQDPIGLAGGLNLYGFAGGDPVNFSDPFGLCPSKHEPHTICVSLFIQAKTLFPGLRGDGRDFSSSSDPSQSRLYIVIDVKNQSVVRKGASPSCTVGGSCSKSPSPLNAMGASFGRDGKILVGMEGHDSKTTVPGVSAFLQFTPNANGGYSIDGFATRYPSIEAYYYDASGTPTTLLQQTESPPICALLCGVDRIRPK